MYRYRFSCSPIEVSLDVKQAIIEVLTRYWDEALEEYNAASEEDQRDHIFIYLEILYRWYWPGYDSFRHRKSFRENP
jgi:hypothetical protein